MAEIVQSLFGVTPEMYQQNQQARADQQAMQYAKLSPFEQANFAIGRGANMLGGVAGRALGGEDPELARISMRQQIARQLNPNDPASIQQAISSLAQAGDPQGAMMLQGEYQKLIESNALVGQRGAAEKASLAQAAKTEFGIKQEEKLRDELSALGPNATQDQILSVVTKYGPPEKVLAALQGSADRATANQARVDAANLANQARIDAAKLAADAKIEAARERGATDLQIARMQTEARRDIAQLAQSFKQSILEQPLNPKELQKRNADYPQATSAIRSFETKADSFVNDIEKLRDSPGLSEITGFAAGRLPGLTANGRAAQALYDKIVAKGGFQALQDLRDASKTGGALGNVSNQEGKQLTASFAAIDRRQNAKDVQEALNQAIGDIQGSKTRLKEAYDMTYSYKAEQPVKGLSSEDQQALNWANSNPKDPRSAQIKKRLGGQ
jgi:hypothetical protein